MGRALATVAVLLTGLVALAQAAAGVSQTFPAPFERVWTAAESALKAEGWAVDRADRPTGTITTRSRRLDGDDDGAFAKNRRVRLHLRVLPSGLEQTTVTVEPEHFIRERVLWVEKDTRLSATTIDPVAPPDHTLEQRVLAAFGKAL
jgi:hypothetical protein